MRNFRSCEPEINWSGHKACFNGRKVDFRKITAGEKKNSHSVAFFQPGFSHAAGQLICPLIKGFIGPSAFFGNYGQSLRIFIGRVG